VTLRSDRGGCDEIATRLRRSAAESATSRAIDKAAGGEQMKIEVKKVEKILATGYGKNNGDS